MISLQKSDRRTVQGKTWDVDGKLVQGSGQGWWEANVEHGVKHGLDLVFDTVLDSSGQHADASKNSWVQTSVPFLAGTWGPGAGAPRGPQGPCQAPLAIRGQALPYRGEDVSQVGLDIGRAGHSRNYLGYNIAFLTIFND